MAATQGYQGNIKVGTNVVAQVKSTTFDLNRMIDDITAMKATPNPAKDFLPTLYDATCSLSCNWDLTDTTGQLAMQNAWFAGTLLNFVLTPNGGTNTYSFAGYIKKIGLKNDVAKVNDATYDIQPTGTVTPV